HSPNLDVRCIPGGVDVDRITPATFPRNGPIRILFVGRHATQKSLDVLLDAFAALPQRNGVTLRLVGDGPTKDSLQDQASRLGIAEHVEFLPWAKREEIPGILADADIFVLPSRDEGMPIVMLEACSAGLPIVATDLPGIRQVITSGETGLLVPVGNQDALRDALHCVIHDQSMRLRMGAAARALVTESYTWKAAAESYLRLVGIRPSMTPPTTTPPSAATG
ncbi:MAG: glycosyltransferase family 4 protein, partial [Pseudorhodoplanes sp.]|nr:glycosyltransferase family 4 protein [Pseudorhodoplanes sp.]